MNTIEQHLRANDTVLHVALPDDWKGRDVKVTVELEEHPAEPKKGTGLSRLRGAWAHLPDEKKRELQQQLDDLRGTDESFDAVGFMREQRDRISREYNENPEGFKEKMARIREQYKQLTRERKALLSSPH